MDKQQALKELKELKARADALEAIINAPDEPLMFGGYHLQPSEGTGAVQWYVSIAGTIVRTNNVPVTDAKYGFAFTSQEAAEKHLKQLELQQRCRIAMAKSWGSVVPNWDDKKQIKYVLRVSSTGNLSVDSYYETYHPYFFKTEEDAKAFIKSLKTDEMRLFIRGVDA